MPVPHYGNPCHILSCNPSTVSQMKEPTSMSPMCDNFLSGSICSRDKNTGNTLDCSMFNIEEQEPHYSIQNLLTQNDEIQIGNLKYTLLYSKIRHNQQEYKFLVDTGSPHSILSYDVYSRFPDIQIPSMHRCQISLKAADGSKISVQGQCNLIFEKEGKQFQQNFIVAKIDEIFGILGMDFLCRYEASINIKKRTMKTKQGKLQLNKQASNSCARVQVTKNVIIPPNSEMFVEGSIDFPCFKEKSIGKFESTSFFNRKGLPSS